MSKLSKELVGASTSPIILTILESGDSYGYEIVQRVKALTDGRFTLQEASIYPVLKKLEEQGMIRSYWKVEDGERPRRYYSVQAKGITQLSESKKEWQTVQHLFGKLWSLE